MKQRYLYKERDRLGTFATYPTSAAKSAVVLAQSGFAYTGKGGDSDDRVTCVFCQAVRSSWRPEDDVEEVHRSLSPNCPLVTGQNSGNVPIVYSSSRSFQELLNAASSTRCSDTTPNRPENALGPWNLTESENTSTQSSLKQNTTTNNSSTTQITSSNNSTTQNARNNNTSANGPTYSELSIVTDRPKRPEYALKSERLKTFANWPRDHRLQPSELSDAEFFYAGYGDCARCFYCGGGLRNWDDEHDVWVEHARWFSKCSFIRQRMGQVFVDTVQDLNKTLHKISFEAVANKMGVADIREETLRKDPAVREVAKLGFPMNIVIQMAKIVKAKDYILSAERLLVRLIEERGEQQVSSPRPQVNHSASGGASGGASNDSETIRQQKHKNGLLRQQTTCKICMDNEVDIVFLPCGHLVSCTECAVALKDCPVCRAHIKGTVRALFAKQLNFDYWSTCKGERRRVVLETLNKFQMM